MFEAWMTRSLEAYCLGVISLIFLIMTGMLIATLVNNWRSGFTTKSWFYKQKKTIYTRNVILGFLYLEWVMIFFTLVGYASESLDEAFEYGSFAFPCLAGILAGGGLLKGAGDDFIKKMDFQFYFWSVVFIGVGYLSYLAHKPKLYVIFYLIIFVIIAFVYFLYRIYRERSSLRDSLKIQGPFRLLKNKSFVISVGVINKKIATSVFAGGENLFIPIMLALMILLTGILSIVIEKK